MEKRAHRTIKLFMVSMKYGIPLLVRRGASEAMRGGQDLSHFSKCIFESAGIPDHPDRALRGHPSSRGGELSVLVRFTCHVPMIH